jgi:hypothetical protein
VDHSNIGRERIDSWDEDNLSLSLFQYKPGKIGQTDTATQFILCFKEFGPIVPWQDIHRNGFRIVNCLSMTCPSCKSSVYKVVQLVPNAEARISAS